MLATVTGKGQVTIPKEIRDRLGIEVGTKLDFQVEADGTLRVRPLGRGSAGLFGLLHDKRRRPCRPCRRCRGTSRSQATSRTALSSLSRPRIDAR